MVKNNYTKEDIIHTFVVLAYKESIYLEDCIKSVLNQKYNSKVVIATATLNKYIKSLADKYNLEIIENKDHRNIGGDFDFAISIGKTKLITIAHQDDIYDYEYSYEMVQAYNKNKDAIILFPDYYEIKNDNREVKNINLKIKRFLLKPLKNIKKSGKRFRKRASLCLGCSIGCPSVTFVKDKMSFPLFENEFKCDVDWNAWEKLSNNSGKFIYINKFLMGHRIHEKSTTTELINDNTRTMEDYIMLKRFWPKPIAFLINKFYCISEKNNNIK